MDRDEAVRYALTKARNWNPSRPTSNQGEALAEFGADLILDAQRRTAERCAEMCSNGARIQQEHADRCRRENKWTAKEMSVSESGTEAYLTARNSLDFWAYQIRREFGLAPAEKPAPTGDARDGGEK